MAKTQISVRDLSIIYRLLCNRQERLYHYICDPNPMERYLKSNPEEITEEERQRRLNENSEYQDILRIKDALGQMQIEVEAQDVVYKADIDAEPAADVAPVVRCGECRRFMEYTDSYKEIVEHADGDCGLIVVSLHDAQLAARTKDDYCSLGTRKDGEDSG